MENPSFTPEDFYRLLEKQCNAEQLTALKGIIVALGTRASALTEGRGFGSDEKERKEFVLSTVLNFYTLMREVIPRIDEAEKAFYFVCDQLGIQLDLTLRGEKFDPIPPSGATPAGKIVNATVLKIEEIIGRKKS